MIKQSEHDAVGAALAAYEHALDVVDDLLGRGTATDRELQDAQDDVDNLAELVTAARQARASAGRDYTPRPGWTAETAWLRDVKLTW